MFENNEVKDDLINKMNIVVPSEERTDDIETGNGNKIDTDKIIKRYNEDLKELKGILKRPDERVSRRSDEAESIIKIFVTLLLTVIYSPIIICDLYYGFTDKSCVNEYPNELNINLKLYLIVSGFVSLFIVAQIIMTTCLISSKNSDVKNSCLVGITAILMMFCGIFHLIWNILGGVIFWGTLYGNGICDKSLSTYVFVSLILKYIASFTALKSNNKNKK